MRSLLVRKDRKETLTLEMMMTLFNKQNGLCAISGVEMTHILQGGRCPSNISIDRIDSTKGYEPDNVQLVCALVNTMKMQYTKEELIGWCQKIVEYNSNPKYNSKGNLLVQSKSANRSFPRTKKAGEK